MISTIISMIIAKGKSGVVFIRRPAVDQLARHRAIIMMIIVDNIVINNGIM